jgi:Na+-driven multidrug efflux pump
MDLLKDNIRKLYFQYLIPSLSSAMVVSIYVMTDAIVIGKGLGPEALSALNLITPLICLLVALGILFGVGGSVHMNIQRGLGNKKKANQFFTISFIGLLITTLILWILFILKMPELLRIMGADEILFPYAMDYMKCILYLLPVITFSNYLSIFVRTDNDPNQAMIGVFCGGIFNIVFDIILVITFHSGIGGAAIASVLGMCIQILICLGHFFKKKNSLQLIMPKQCPSTLMLVLSGGLSSFITELANGIIVFLFNIQILRYCGQHALAVYSVIANCVILFNSLFTGVGQAIQPIISINFGAKLNERIICIKRYAYMTIVIMGSIFMLSGVLFSDILCKIFIELTPEIHQYSRYAIPIYFLTFIPMGLNLLTTYYLQAVLQSKKSLMISLLRNVVLSGILILTLPHIFGGVILWGVMPMVDISTCLFIYILNKAAPS